MKKMIMERIRQLDTQEEECNLTDYERLERVALKETLGSILLQEEILWWQCSRVQWLLHGDKNTKFFYSYICARKCKNTISKVGVNRMDVVEKEEIKKLFAIFYRGLFSKNLSSDG